MADEMPDADELAALLALDALTPNEQADAELRHGIFPAEFADVVTALAQGSAAQPPDPLRASVLSRALGRRAADRPVGAVPESTPMTAYRRTVDEFHDLLAALRADEWTAAAHTEHGTVRELVAHLTGVERLCVAWLDPNAPPPVDPHLDHVTATRPAVDQLAGLDVQALVREWHDTALRVASAAATGDPDRPVSFHDLTTDVGGLLVMRTFELWAHGMDIALATGRPMPTLDPQRMTLLSARLMAALPMAMVYRRGAPLRGTARFVLTGPAGGVYTVPLDPAATASAGADVTIVTDVIDLCRVAARRLPAAELPATIEGDHALALAILGDVDALARD